MRITCCGKISPILFLGITLLFLPAGLFSQSPDSKIHDDAGLFSQSQREALEKRAQALAAETAVDFVIVTTNTTGAKTSMAFADDFFDDNHFGIGSSRDGMLLLFNMQEREIWISTHALALDYFKDSDIEVLLDKVFVPLQNASYEGAAEEFLINAAAHIKAKKAAEGPATVTEVDPLIKLWDYAGLLSEEQKAELSVRLLEVTDKYSADCAVLTLTSTGGKSMTAFARDIFFDSGYGIGPDRDGILLLVKMQPDGNWNLELYISGAIQYDINNEHADSLLRVIGREMEREDYYAALGSFIEYTHTTIRYHRATGLEWLKLRLTPELVGRSLLYGCGLALLIVLIMFFVQRRRSSAAPSVQAYMDQYNINFTVRTDTLTGTHTTRTPIPKPQPSSGYSSSYSSDDHRSSSGVSSSSSSRSSGGSYSSGTSSHRSSSGSTHGGGGRKF
ncbi:TPM domain-containing protein [Breznakiella homolactica]|uniref:TPM domain-containing protein n=1 Tax=Breznakiella homolactica TaxID=2798577 RepID=A0A7T7XK04_9SPIR|nr:TPM domain-containing protein [Breznakiella homolactica]QQO07824.1 TPM domain-containing protein [Breznakiella homolactica]